MTIDVWCSGINWSSQIRLGGILVDVNRKIANYSIAWSDRINTRKASVVEEVPYRRTKDNHKARPKDDNNLWMIIAASSYSSLAFHNFQVSIDESSKHESSNVDIFGLNPVCWTFSSNAIHTEWVWLIKKAIYIVLNQMHVAFYRGQLNPTPSGPAWKLPGCANCQRLEQDSNHHLVKCMIVVWCRKPHAHKSDKY